jgi:hypothetical protein
MQHGAQTDRVDCHREHCARKLKEVTTLGLGREIGDVLVFTGFSEFILLFSAFLALSFILLSVTDNILGSVHSCVDDSAWFMRTQTYTNTRFGHSLKELGRILFEKDTEHFFSFFKPCT